MKQKTFIAISALVGFTMVSTNVKAQSYVTYNHDKSKMNQITVMEIGSGSLTPEIYYTATHNSYKKSAASKNKQGYRTLAATNLYPQVAYAEAVDSAMSKRAKIEALNLADRTIDLAWQAEGSKIEQKMQDFQNNIGLIIQMGGNYQDKQQWTEYYHQFECAIKSVKDGYMPNAQRKKMYLEIYASVNKKNNTLVRKLNNSQLMKETSELLAARADYNLANKRTIIQTAKQKWKSASNSNESGGSSSGSFEED